MRFMSIAHCKKEGLHDYRERKMKNGEQIVRFEQFILEKGIPYRIYKVILWHILKEVL